MNAKDKTAEALLERAYALDGDKQAKALYEDWADTYDTTMLDGLGYITPQKTAVLLANALQDNSSRILDVGSGTGLAGHYLAELEYSNIDALDYSQAMLDQAAMRSCHEKQVYSQTFCADLNQPLNLPSATYDGLICTGTFTHAHVGPSCLDELFRVLKTGGSFACTVHKDIWQSAGFDKKVAELSKAGILKTVSIEMGTYYLNDTQPEGYFIVWEKLA
jgi:predicted TPR repeat methyltransferase